MSENPLNQPSKFRTKKWVEINDDARGNKFKTSMLKLSLCDYSDAYILLKVTISIVEKAGDNPNNNNKDVVFKNYVPFTDCISEVIHKYIMTVLHLNLNKKWQVKQLMVV